MVDLDPLIHARRPALWLHGHTHAQVDVVVGATRVVANPHGYVRYEPEAVAAFRRDLVMRVPAGSGAPTR